MANPRSIWNYEIKKVDKIARRLLESKEVRAGWRILLLPMFLVDYIRFRKHLRVTCKNLLLIKKLAFDGAKASLTGWMRHSGYSPIHKGFKRLSPLVLVCL